MRKGSSKILTTTGKSHHTNSDGRDSNSTKNKLGDEYSNDDTRDTGSFFWSAGKGH